MLSDPDRRDNIAQPVSGDHFLFSNINVGYKPLTTIPDFWISQSPHHQSTAAKGHRGYSPPLAPSHHFFSRRVPAVAVYASTNRPIPNRVRRQLRGPCQGT